MTLKDSIMAMTIVERQVLSQPAILKIFLCILVSFTSPFNMYVAYTGRTWASATLSLQLFCLLIALLVFRSGMEAHRKILVYRYLFRFQLLVFGMYQIVTVGCFYQLEVSSWCFIFVLLVSLLISGPLGLWIILIFNLAVVGAGPVVSPALFRENNAFLIRFDVGLIFFSCLLAGVSWFRYNYLLNLDRTQLSLVESEKSLKAEIRRRDEAETRLRHAIKMEVVGKVAAGVAHDLNNILAGIVTYPDLLLLDLPRDHSLRAPLETIKSSGTRAAAIVDDLLTLSRRGVAVVQPVDFGKLVRDYMESIEQFQLTAEFSHVRFLSRINTSAAWVNGSAVHLTKALSNLVRNGAEAITRDGDVRILLEAVKTDHPATLAVQEAEMPPGTYICLTIEDTGTGIDPSDFEAVFEPFFTRKQMGRSGTGLGMTLVLGTVEDHHGYIRMTSVPEEGTAISLFFPAGEPRGQNDLHRAKLEAVTGQGEQILVVDDEPIQLKITEKLLRRLGYRVMTCSRGEQCVGVLAEAGADLVILDLIMEPGMGGVETCEKLLARNPGQKVMFVTGFSDADTLARAESLSHGPCLRKPYTLEKMGEMVRARLLG